MGVLEILVLFMLILLPFFYFSKSQRQRRSIAKAIDQFNGPPWYPILGTTWPLVLTPREDLYQHMFDRRNIYGPIFRSWVGPYPQIHLTTSKHAEVVLKSNVNITKAKNYDFVKPWLGEGLITSTGAHWQRFRKLLTPTFHFKILDNFQEIFSEKALILANELQPLADGKYFDILPYLTHCALDIICETAMGVEINAMKNCDSEYIKALYRITEIILYRWFRPWLHADFIFYATKTGKEQKKVLSIIHGFADKVINDRKKLLQSNGVEELSEEDIILGRKKRLAFLDLLLQHNMEKNEMTDFEIREEVDTFMFAGHDTTTASTSWTLFALGNHPEVQQKVHEEIDSIFHGDERPITPEDLTKLQYTERVLKEAMRIHTLVPYILRNLTEDIEIEGKTIPAGVTAVINIANMHMDPEVFPDPSRFDPDRFLPENVAKRSSYAYIPFSAGPRNCLGQKFALRNAKTLLTTILRRYKIKSLEKPDEIKVFGDIVVKPQKGMYLAFESRT